MFDKTDIIVLKRITLDGEADIAGVIGIIAIIGCILVAYPCSYFATR